MSGEFQSLNQLALNHIKDTLNADPDFAGFSFVVNVRYDQKTQDGRTIHIFWDQDIEYTYELGNRVNWTAIFSVGIRMPMEETNSDEQPILYYAEKVIDLLAAADQPTLTGGIVESILASRAAGTDVIEEDTTVAVALVEVEAKLERLL